MRRRPRAAWLLDTTDPQGAGVMAIRRMSVLGTRLRSSPLTLHTGRREARRESAFHRVISARGVAGMLHLAESDLVVTTSPRTLEYASARAPASNPIVHFVHTPALHALSSERFMENISRATRVVVPAVVDPRRFSDQIGLAVDQVEAHDDFTLAENTYLGTARSRVILAVGMLTPDSGVLQLAEGFRLAAPSLPGWQLRFCGWGPERAPLNDFVRRHGLHSSVLVLGPRHDIATEYLDAGIVVRIAQNDASGLSVLEALTAGIPVLGSPSVPAVRRFVNNGRNGVVLSRTDPESIAEALVRMGDTAGREQLAAGARELPSGVLTDHGAHELRRLFDGALGTHGSR